MAAIADSPSFANSTLVAVLDTSPYFFYPNRARRFGISHDGQRFLLTPEADALGVSEQAQIIIVET